MDRFVNREEFEDLTTDIANMLEVFATSMEAMREGLAKTSAKLRGYKIFYCRRCKKPFAYRELEKVQKLTIPCPICGDGLIPAVNLFKTNFDFEKIEDDK